MYVKDSFFRRLLYRGCVTSFCLGLGYLLLAAQQELLPPSQDDFNTIVPLTPFDFVSSGHATTTLPDKIVTETPQVPVADTTIPVVSKVIPDIVDNVRGGFLEPQTAQTLRPFINATGSWLPHERKAFTFPSPYNTRAYRITTPEDCGGKDCVESIGYSYWSNMNNSAGLDSVHLVVTLNISHGGEGPTLFSLNKVTEKIERLGSLFNVNDVRRFATGEGWYFSLTAPAMLYIQETPISPSLERYIIFSRTVSKVFDISSRADIFGTDRYVSQLHTSSDDSVHSFTVKASYNYESLGCGVYFEATDIFEYFPIIGTEYDECQIDKSGQYLIIKEQIDGKDGEDNRIINLITKKEIRLYDREGAAGHSDLGFRYMLAVDNWYESPVIRLWKLNTDPLAYGAVAYREPSWTTTSINHPSWNNARDESLASQYACGSGVNTKSGPRTNEVVCFRVDGTGEALIVAPVMTDLDASGGGGDDYVQAPKGNIDPTGEYFIWSSNQGGDRQDVYVVKVPWQRLFGY